MLYKARLGSPEDVGDAEGYEWLAVVARELEGAPLPEQARKFAGDVLDAADPEQIRIKGEAAPAHLGNLLRVLCGVAPFFAKILQRHPDLLLELCDDDLCTQRSLPELELALEAALAQPGDAPPEERLRAFKYRELARITVRDCTEALVPLPRSEVTLLELSQLADVLLQSALNLAKERLSGQLEAPRLRDEVGTERPLRFCVLGLGKLGAGELNYSSDVDLVYIQDPVPVGSTCVGAAPKVYFDRLAIEFGKIVGANLREGFLYRVDLELRPNGTQGELVVTDGALLNYYEYWAQAWEKAAFMKARPVAGDVDLGWHAIVAIAPAIYQATINYRFTDGIRSLKAKIQSARGGAVDAFNVKIDPGGIRDVEFIAQALQLLHGARIPQLRDRSTQGALRNLEAVGLLEPDTAVDLHEAYLYLRRIENRLQMEGERQVHRLPKTSDGMARLARAMGDLRDDAAERLAREVERRRHFLRSLTADTVGEDNHERVAELFQHAAPGLFQFDLTRVLVQELIGHFAVQIDECADAERALNNLDRFIRASGERRSYLELLLDRPELVQRLVGMFGASNFLSSYLARYPRLIEPIFRDPDVLLFDREALQADHAAVLAECAEASGNKDLETQLDALRLFHHKQIVNVGLIDLASEAQRSEVECSLGEIATVCIERALGIARDQLEARGKAPPPAAQRGGFLVVAMGKLASFEITYGSDLDLIFLYQRDEHSEGSEADVQDYFARLAQCFMSAIQTPTGLGACYEVDARLRPSGNQGLLVSSIQSYARYHAESAATWERQALLRSRPVAGSVSLADEFRALRLQILGGPNPDALALDIHLVRTRMEEELAKETTGKRDYKTGRGGALDIECAVQYLQLQHGGLYPELLEVAPLDSICQNLERLDLLDGECARVLREGWAFLQELGSRMRIVENRSISSINVEHGDQSTLARQLGYSDAGGEGSARRALMNDYRDVTESVRSVYLEIIGLATDV